MSKKKYTNPNNYTFELRAKPLIVVFLFILFYSCKSGKERPDISNIQIDLKVHRFEQQLFSIDSAAPKPGLKQLIKKYPDFAPLFVSNVLGLGPITDSNRIIESGIRRFIHLSTPVYDRSEKIYRNFKSIDKELKIAFRYLKYYYPSYPIPEIYTTIGPLDALPPLSNGEPSPNFMGPGFLAIGLQFYLGADEPLYSDEVFSTNIVPTYRSRRFSKEYIAADVMKLVLDDIYPDSSRRLPLGEQFIERGKRLYILGSLLPDAHDTILIGYTSKQLEWCQKNEREIYNFFLQQNLLFERDLARIMPFISDGPYTQGMPENSPGNIGAFLGWQMVKSYHEKMKTISIQQLMKVPAADIIRDSGYKPR